MEQPHIDLSDEARDWIANRVASGAFRNESDYLERLIEVDRRAREELQTELIKGLDSGQAEPMTSADWAALRDRLEERISARNDAG